MKKIALLFIGVFIAIQLIRPDKNSTIKNFNTDIATLEEVPYNIQKVLENSCYDCHSNQTKYEWYHDIAPISWIITNHIKNGKEHLNFSEWHAYNNNQKRHIFEEMEEVLIENEMPLKSYLLIHPEARLKSTEKQQLLAWINKKK